jgi:hypothetical protein
MNNSISISNIGIASVGVPPSFQYKVLVQPLTPGSTVWELVLRGTAAAHLVAGGLRAHKSRFGA